MPVCGNYLFFELPKKIVLNPKDGIARALMHRVPIYFSRFRLFSQVILVYNT